MKNRGCLKQIGVFIMLLTITISCSSSDDNNTQDNADNISLFDKWWYDSNDFAADIYLHSNGIYEQKKVVQGINYTATGDWVYENESSGIIRIDNLAGNGQLQPTVWFKVSNIQANTITIQQSINGSDYSEEILYQDTDN